MKKRVLSVGNSQQKRTRMVLLGFMLGFAAVMGCSEPQQAPFTAAEVNVHPQGWAQRGSSAFHGDVLAAAQYDKSTCRQCHGSRFDGGLVQVSCFTCHASYPHPEGWAGRGEQGHPAYLRAQTYDLAPCQTCHGADYSLSKVDISCLTCHVNAGGPEACNTCHGAFAEAGSDLRHAAPPAGLIGETDQGDPAVGAHQMHLGYYVDAAATCAECHIVPSTLRAAGHIDGDGEAEVLFRGTLAALVTEGGARQPQPAYARQTLACANTYCHGNWALMKSASAYDFIYAAEKIEGNNATPIWTEPETGDCGSCHDLPPRGHNPFGIQACSNCHSGVIDRLGNIIDKSKHINGKVNVFQQEYPMF